MAVDSTGTRNQPLFDESAPINDADEKNAISNWAAAHGNRVADTRAVRLVQTGANVWEGLEWFETDTGFTWIYRSGAWKLEAGDYGWTISNLAIQSGWGTLTDPGGGTSNFGPGGIRRVDQLVELRARLTRTGATLTPDSAGNLTDTNLLQIQPATYIPTSTVYGNFYVPGVAQGSLRIGTDGYVAITDMYPGASIPNGAVVQMAAVYFGPPNTP